MRAALADVPHGTNSGYTYHGCRCDLCRKAHADANKQYERKYKGRRPFVDSGPVEAQVRCLLAFGVGPGRISAAMGKAHRGRPRIRKPKVRATTADAIGRLHWGLWISHGPFRRHCHCETPMWVMHELERAS